MKQIATDSPAPRPRIRLFATVTRLGVGGLFAVSGAIKAADPTALATAISHYDLVSPAVAQASGHVLPWLEISTGLALLTSRAQRGGWLNASMLSWIFLVAVTSAWWRDLDISCGCFATARTIDGLTLLTNVGLVALTALGQRLHRQLNAA